MALWLVLSNFLTISGINQLVKFLIQRPRPDLFDHLILVGGYSFPSGHSMGSVVFYGTLALTLVYLWPKHFKHPALLYSLVGLLSLALAWSRIFLGVHYFSDTLAGLSLGLTCLILAKAAMDRWVDERPQVE
ncbi:phosphatase PAP2 family protein [Aerococcus sanguinicola]|uniref:phosphatase PAP2 family protein n=1 Tax=Aerococcus sanguinicola TaxID=119206 RepID=UPI0018A7A820|nr:phosphatase PAP2 family protein [Aerococcus sanguinicola]